MREIIEKLQSYNLNEETYEKVLKTIQDKVNGIEDIDWQEIIDKYDIKIDGKPIHRDTLRKSSQTIFGAGFVSEYLEQKHSKENSNDEYLNKLEEKQREIKLDTIKLRDKLREWNKVDYAQARFDNLKDVMIEKISKLNDLEIKPFKECEKTNNLIVANLLISDLHLGLICDNDFNTYNIEIAKERLNILQSKVAYCCKMYNINRLNIELLGDLVCGHIHTSLRVQQEEDAISNIMIVCELLANFINNLKEYVSDIKVYSVWGNHGRLVPNKKESINIENVERLIPFYLRARLDNTVEIIDSKNDFLEMTVQGRKIVIAHGDKDNINNAVNNYTRLLKYVSDEIHLAHYHSVQMKDDCDIDIVVNGSIVSTDDYALSIRKVTKPSQIMRVYLGEDIITHKIML